MINTDDLVRGVLTGVLGGRRKKSKNALRYLTGGRGGSLLSNPQTLLTVAGVAWGIFETMQNSNAPNPGTRTEPGSGTGTGTSASPLPPLPVVPGLAEVPADGVRMIRLAIAAACADGQLSDADRALIVAQVPGAEAMLDRELKSPRPLAEIVSGVTDPAQRATLYVLAFGIIRADESVSGAERIFLAQLANHLGLDPATVAKLETDAASRIDAQG